MKNNFIVKTVVCFASVLLAYVNPGYACFDTFLLLQRKSMVYPTGYYAADVLAEYSFNDTSKPENDSYFTNYNMYYGLADGVSLQMGLSQAESTRTDEGYTLQSWSVRGVFNAVKAHHGNYFADIVAEHHTGIDIDESVAHVSVPNLFYVSRFAFVIHPSYELNYSKGQKEHSFGGHGGLFYTFNNVAIIGLGGEFASAQSSSALGKRFTNGDAAASLFIGIHLGNVYFQNEFSKGLHNTRDYGFAATLKCFFNTGLSI